MTAHHHYRAAVSALALAAALGLGGAAHAQVTAQEVWEDWKAGFALYGEAGLSIGSETNEGGVVTVTDVGFSSTDETGATVTASLPSMTFTENGDGTVAVTMSEEMPVTISSPADPATGSGPMEVALALRQPGMTITASGAPDAITYDLAAARYAVELDRVTEAGAEVPGEFLFAFNDVSGSYTSAVAAMRSVDYDLTAGSLDILVDFTNPDDGSAVTFSGKVNDIATQASVALPLDITAETADAAFVNGLSIDGGYSYGAADYIFEFADAAGPTSGTARIEGGQLAFNMDAAALGYDSTARGVAVEATSAMMPFPISASIAEYGINLLIPAAKSDAPADWTFGINLTDLDVNDEVWALFDPSAVLPRDPATLVLDLSGTATMLYDLFDPAQAEAASAAPVPGEVNSVSIDALNVAVAGASVTGTGAFTLDNADTTTFAGMPAPEGSAEFTLTGINGLIDKLVSMGLVPADQVMGARMMLGLVAVPGEGEDTLVSRIEVTANGQVLANGQRLR